MRPINYEAITAMKNCIQENMTSGRGYLTLRSIAEETGVPFQTVGRYIQQFIDRGEIEADDEYGYVLTETASKINRTRGIPLVGNIACGALSIAEQDITDYIKVPEKLISDGEYFLLRAQGESMINIGIEPGDLVLIRKQSYANPGQVAVVISTEFSDAGGTLKRYYPEPEKKRIRLHPENDDMKDFYVRECIVQGVAKKVFKMRDIE